MAVAGLSGVAVGQVRPSDGEGPSSSDQPSAQQICASAPTTSTSQQATSPCSPVNIATPVDFHAGYAARGATIVAGDARFQVLQSGLIRLEYSPTGTFEDAPTANVVNRSFDVPRYSVWQRNGWLVVRTDQATLTYRLGSGPFTPSNTSFTYLLNGQVQTSEPNWTWECPFGQVCDAGAATLAGPAGLAANHLNYQSTAGFIQNLGQANGAQATWTVLNAPAGNATLTVRYANYIGGLGGPAARTIDVVVNGTDTQTMTLPPTASWDTWGTATATVALSAGTNTVGLLCGTGDSCNVNVDTVSLAAPSSPSPALPTMNFLGGWSRSFDSATYGPAYNCPPGTPTAAQCQAALPVMHSGLLDRAGWYLLDDSQTAEYNSQGWVQPRPANGDVQDGYLFVYGEDYQTPLQELAHLTGPSPLLPESTFGVWYSDYHAYSTSDYENTLVPAFRANNVPLDTLSVDTNWKAPNFWDGWEWNTQLFPDAQGFLQWAKSQGINVTLNIHASISNADPLLSQAEAVAGKNLADYACFSPANACKVWDWSNVSQAESYFTLQQPFEQQGTAFWWLDWCCDNSTVSMPGLTPDNWVNHLQAQEMLNKDQRGYVLSRIGSSFQQPDIVYPAGPWSAHTSTVHFTGDTWGTWNTLQFQAELSADEATIGEPYVSNDIGSFLGAPPGNPNDNPDLYARWVQLGAFQPILRLHSSNGNRLPWDYPQPANSIAANFLRLREALVPYTYTLAAQAQSGLPITRPLYLDYPDQAAAYTNPDEYLYGPDMLVAPVTTPGAVASEQVWFPPGRWVDWFTGATFTGPSQATINVPLDRMPVFVRAGGIIPEQPAMEHVGAAPVDPLTLRVFAGNEGQFNLYQDAGTGLGYQAGQYSVTPITTTSGPPRGARANAEGLGGGDATRVVIGRAQGSYPGMPSSRSYLVQLVDVSQPTRVTARDGQLPQVAPGGSDGWWYDAAHQTLHVSLPETSVQRPIVLTEVGGTAVDRSEPAVAALTIDPSTPLSLSPGQQATVTTTVANDGPGTISNVNVSLSAPAGWQVTPSQTVASIAEGASATQSWTVTAPAGGTGTQTAALQATATYVSNVTGTNESVTVTEQPPPAAPPVPPPSITSISPSSGGVGTVETITGNNFGATQGTSYVLFFEGPTSWGANFDGVKLDILSWSNTSVQFALPAPGGPGGIYHIYPGQTGYAVIDVAGSDSNAYPINTTASVTTPPNAPVISSVQPTTGSAGTTITITGNNFGATDTAGLSDFVTLVDSANDTFGAPGSTALDITNWSNTSISFVLPTGIASGTATVSVDTNNFASNSQTVNVT